MASRLLVVTRQGRFTRSRFIPTKRTMNMLRRHCSPALQRSFRRAYLPQRSRRWQTVQITRRRRKTDHFKQVDFAARVTTGTTIYLVTLNDPLMTNISPPVCLRNHKEAHSSHDSYCPEVHWSIVQNHDPKAPQVRLD